MRQIHARFENLQLSTNNRLYVENGTDGTYERRICAVSNGEIADDIE